MSEGNTHLQTTSELPPKLSEPPPQTNRYTALVAPYEVAFIQTAPLDAVFVIDRLVDAYFISDIIVNFFRPLDSNSAASYLSVIQVELVLLG